VWYNYFLQDAGYGEKSLFAPEDDNEEETQTKIEDEVCPRHSLALETGSNNFDATYKHLWSSLCTLLFIKYLFGQYFVNI